MRKIRVETSSANEAYDVWVGSGLLDTAGEFVTGAGVTMIRRAAIISNNTVFSLYGDRLVSSLQRAGIRTNVQLIGDGERFKNIRTLGRTLTFLSESGIKRSDAVVALGGGVVGDLSGLAASLHLRGVPLFNIPTSLLAMLDASVGGKTGINSKFGKNLIGTIYQPEGVLADVSVLATLPQRHIRAGLYEAVKHGALSGKKLLNNNTRLIEALSEGSPEAYDSDLHSRIPELLAENIAFKVSIVANDAAESIKNIGPRSRKILNFGHTLAHAIEKATNYRGIYHGEAVGYGILFAAELSKKLANCPESDINLLNDVVHRVGPLPTLTGIALEDVLDAFVTDKKNVAEGLQMILLKKIGTPSIVTIGEDERKPVETILKQFLKDKLR
jgi:3-dehydroquinate synthase